MWTLKGYDTFERTEYYLPGEYESEGAALVAAQKQLDSIQKTQPTETSGGQEEGIQDRVLIVRPDGTQYWYVEGARSPNVIRCPGCTVDIGTESAQFTQCADN